MSGDRSSDASPGSEGRAGRDAPAGEAPAPHGPRPRDRSVRSGPPDGPGEPGRSDRSGRPRKAEGLPPDPIGTLFFMILFVLLLVGLWGTVFWMLLER